MNLVLVLLTIITIVPLSFVQVASATATTNAGQEILADTSSSSDDSSSSGSDNPIIESATTVSNINDNGQNNETNQTQIEQEPILTCWDNSTVEDLADCPMEVKEDLQAEPLEQPVVPPTP